MIHLLCSNFPRAALVEMCWLGVVGLFVCADTVDDSHLRDQGVVSDEGCIGLDVTV